MRLEDPLAQLFAMKLGLLALSTTSTIAPPLYKLRRIGETLPLKYRPFAELAYASTLYMGQLMSSQEYAKVYQSTAAKFKFGDELQDLIFAFLFIDLKVVTLPDFAIRLIEYFQDKSPILSSYVQAIVERNELFTKLYSVASYSEFKDQVSIWKNKIASTLDDVNQFLQPGFLNKLLKRRPEAGVTGSLNLGTYIALYTALAESPVLSLSERKEVLEEVWHVYTQYFRKLLQSDLQLFSYTIDSIFQSVSVVLGEIFTLLPLKKRSAHIQKMKEFLQDVFSAITEEWIREHEDVSTIFVITNAIFPKLYTADVLPDEAIRLAYLAMRLQDVKVLEKQQKRDPLGFVTDVGNLNGALATLALKLLKGEQKKQLLPECVRILVNVHKFFLLHGIVCRDDVFTLTHLTSEIIDEVDSKTVNEFLNPIIALNQIAITDFEKNESDVAMMARPLIELLMKAWKRLGDDVYRQTAYQVYQIASKAWQKYGFNGKADEFEQLYGKILNSS